ncbi:MAG: hypothetical protein JW997_03655 [Actinobacteria bacterium]|nr:hypothetical protein [Actinomycetota bacterium]
MTGKIYKRPAKVFLAFINLIAFIATVVVNALATILPINNKSTGELSDQYPNLFVPSGLTFSIWGLIYILLAIFIIYQLVIAFKKNTEAGLFEKIGILFFISSILNIGWILAWHYEIVWLSLIIMVLLFIVLLSIYLRLRVGKSDAGYGEKLMAHVPFSVYIGWITIATIANVTALLVDLGWNGFNLSQQFWAVLVIAVGIIIALLVVFTRNDMFYCLVVVWSLLGILLKRLEDTSTPAQGVIIISIVGMALIVLGIIIQLARRKKVY